MKNIKVAEKKQEIPKNQKILFITLITVIIILLVIIFILRSTIQKNYSESLKIGPALSPEMNYSLCTNREKTANVCKGDVICQCENRNYSNPFFFANNAQTCPEGCNILKPVSSEGAFGSCNLALLMASDVPLCTPGCSNQAVLKKSENQTSECCIVTMETHCIPSSK